MPAPDDEIAALESAALELLRQIVSEAYDKPGGDGPIELGFSYRHANNLVWLATELLESIEEGHIASPPIIARSMLESVFNLAAAVRIEHFPAKKIVWELRDFLARLKSLDLEALLGEKHSEVVALIARLESQYGLEPNEKSWSIARIAREGQTTAFLRKEYFILSGHIHSSSFALLSRDDGVYDNLIHQTVISCLLVAAGLAAQLIPTNGPQAHIDRATELGDRHLDLISRGIFDMKG